MAASPLSRLPSLDLLRGFVAVGRRMSITLAAQDLCLTQSAVSRQIQTLEQAVGVKLLTRGHRSVSFTPEGERLFQVADGAIRRLQETVGGFAACDGHRPVTITASVGVTSLWLLPRLARFQSAHPDIEVRVDAGNRIADLRNEGMDLAVRYCSAASASAGALRLFGEVLAPVAHPTLGLAALNDAKTLSRYFLLEYEDSKSPWLSWNGWLNAVGWSDAKPRGTHRFNQYDQVIQAALGGQGIALGRMELIRTLLDEGRLVDLAPSGTRAVDHAYWLVQAETAPRLDVLRVVDWLRQEAGL